MRIPAGARALVARTRDRAIAPLVARMDRLQEASDQRLDELTRRMASVEQIIETMDGRAATVSERSVAQGESQVRLTRRVEEIEKLLGSAGGE